MVDRDSTDDEEVKRCLPDSHLTTGNAEKAKGHGRAWQGHYRDITGT